MFFFVTYSKYSVVFYNFAPITDDKGTGQVSLFHTHFQEKKNSCTSP